MYIIQTRKGLTRSFVFDVVGIASSPHNERYILICVSLGSRTFTVMSLHSSPFPNDIPTKTAWLLCCSSHSSRSYRYSCPSIVIFALKLTLFFLLFLIDISTWIMQLLCLWTIKDVVQREDCETVQFVSLGDLDTRFLLCWSTCR
jgi:hypothetical protein